jgi:LmbE family N-acetylglucosaminyl deacetylase
MIVPLISDEEWREKLQGIQAWNPPDLRTVIIAPHPDDETLGAGGLIGRLCKRDMEVRVIAVTDGENAYPNEVNLGPIRRHEQAEALEVLGVNPSHIVRLALPDREVSRHESRLIELLIPLADEKCHILAPWTGDFHPDHEACGRAAQQVAQRTRANLSFYFFWTWHRGTLEILSSLKLRAFPLDVTAINRKAEALQKHRSQLIHPSGEPILPKYLLGPTLWPYEVFAIA